jgi:lysophospholipase L1-like esterase
VATGGAGATPQGGRSGAAGRATGIGGASTAGKSAAGASAGGTASSVTLWLAGDSTMADGETPCPVGWGKEFASYFDTGVSVKNDAVGGRSIRTWLYNVTDTMDQTGECVLEVDANGDPTVQAHWTQMLAGMKAGDYLFIQFGINDGDPSCDRHVGIDAFEQSLGVMAQAAKDRGAQPIFLTPVSAIACTGSMAKGTRGAYVTATLDAGTQFDVPVIELHALSVALYNSLGFCPIPGGDVSADTTGPVGDFFCDDHTHFESAGAVQIAGLVAKALADQGIALASHLN